MMQQQRQRLRGVATITDRPARIGKLKIGEKREIDRGGKTIEVPAKLDYIRAVDGAGDVIRAFHDVFGERPTEFRAVFPSNDPDDFWWEAYRRYGSGTGLVCHGDGRQAIVEETGETVECPCEHAQGDRPTCKPVASLSLFVFDVPALGVFQIDTASLNSIKNIRWFIHALPLLTGGQYAGIPFRVKVEPFQAVHDGKASVAYQWKLDLLPGYRPADLRMAAQQAVDAFLLPPDLAGRPLLDEAKPEDLYAGLSAVTAEETERTDDAEAVHDDNREALIPAEVLAAEELYAATLLGSGWPKAKVDAKLSVMRSNREKTIASGEWGHYVDWLTASTEQVPKGERS